MTNAKGNRPEESPEPIPPPEIAEHEEPPEPPEPAEVPAPATPGKKTPGVKEVPPFQWKLVGEAGGMALTLYKAVEREEIEAHLERVRKDGYYINLRVMGVNEKVVQPAPPKGRAKPKTPTPIAKAPKRAEAPKAKVKDAAKAASAPRRAAPPPKVSKPVKPKPSGKAAKKKPRPTSSKKTASKS